MKGRISVGKCRASHHRMTYMILLGLLALGAICLGRQEPAGRPEPLGRQPSRPRRATPTRRLKTIQLPEPIRSGAVAFERALVEQRSVQPPGSERLEFTKIGQLAWAAQGVMAPLSATTAPPATTPSTVTPLGPIPLPPEIVGMRVYFVLPDGAYLYDPVAHSLQQISDGDLREALAAALWNQPGAPIGGCQIILAGSSRDFAARFGAQARTVMLLLAGRMAQNIELQAAALGLTFISINDVQGAPVRKVVRLARNLDPFYVAFVGYPPGEAPQAPATEPVGSLTGRALLVLPPSGFHDEEYFQTKRALELAGVQVDVASTRMEPITGMLGGTAQANVLLRQASADNYDGVIFIGGLGAASYFNDPAALNLARQAATQRKVLAAIGTAPSILASATVLRSVRSTAYISEQNRLTLAGAIYTGNPVEKDGLIVTATGPLAVAPFTQAILDGLGELGRP